MVREWYLQQIKAQFRVHPICGILGPRQVGKTTLAKVYVEEYAPDDAHFFDLENLSDIRRLENPMLALSSIPKKLIVIDEIQRRPDLFPVLRVLADTFEKKRRFLILGSASRDLIRQSSETLAGRVGYIELPLFSLEETKRSNRLWLRGGFPRSYLARSNNDSYLWRQDYITTFLESAIPPQQIQRFWLMLAHYHGQIFNASEISKSMGVSDHTVRKYLEILAGTFMIRILTPWFESLKKRQIKSPKIYFRDSGILHALVGISDVLQLQLYPRLGSFWEGFVLEEIIRTFHATPKECYFWATQAGAELDLLIMRGTKRFGFECNYTDAPKITKSMHITQQDLKLNHLAILYPGKDIFPLDTGIVAYGLETIATGEFMQKMHLLR